MHIDTFYTLMASADDVLLYPSGHPENVINTAAHLVKVRCKCEPIYNGDTVHLGPRLAVALADYCESMAACWSSRLLAAKEVVCLSRTVKLDL